MHYMNDYNRFDFAIIGDIVNSQSVSNRYMLQEEMKEVLVRINEKYSDSIVSIFEMKQGDDFQARLNDITVILPIIQEIMLSFSTVQFRFGIGYGGIETKSSRETSYGSDGMAWYYARDAIEEIKESNKRNKLYQLPNIRFKLGPESSLAEDMINSIIEMLDIIYSGWTKKQKLIAYEIFKRYGFSNDFVQSEVAEKIKISSQLLNKTLKSMNYFYYIKMYQQLIVYMKKEA